MLGEGTLCSVFTNGTVTHHPIAQAGTLQVFPDSLSPSVPTSIQSQSPKDAGPSLSCVSTVWPSCIAHLTATEASNQPHRLWPLSCHVSFHTSSQAHVLLQHLTVPVTHCLKLSCRSSLRIKPALRGRGGYEALWTSLQADVSSSGPPGATTLHTRPNHIVPQNEAADGYAQFVDLH